MTGVTDRLRFVCVCVFISGWQRLHPYDRACSMLSGGRVDALMWRARAQGGVNVSLWQTLIIFNPGRISLKWKAAFQFYNPVDLISPPATVHTVQLHGQDWPDELYSPQTPYPVIVVSKRHGTPCLNSPALTFTNLYETALSTHAFLPQSWPCKWYID